MIQSPNDDKEYLAVTLANQLRVLVVHNEHSNKAAAALAVNVGHFSDPDDRHGMAHFLEHMLFLGTEKYPEGNEYQKFISHYGGSNNAWTATEHTCFFFDIHHSHFEQAIDRFSQFFIAPLLSKEFVEKERENIDAEYKMKLKDDVRRLYDVHKATINEKHPFSKFSVGNTSTLGDLPGRALEQEVRAFFEEHYFAEAMTLVLEGPQSIDELTQLANKYFTDIKQGDKQVPPVSESLYLPHHQKIKIEVQPVKNERQLIISFAMPAIDKYYRNKPEATLCYLLGHEGPGSILSALKQNDWAFSLTAGSGINGSNFKDFNINISLTESGLANINQVIELVFAYINLLKDTSIGEQYYLEKKAISNLAFNYQEKLKPLESACQLVVNMQHYPANDYIFGDYAMDGLDKEKVNELLSYLSTDNLRVLLIHPKVQPSKETRWYQVPYDVTPIDEALLNQWQLAKAGDSLALPEENKFIVANPNLLTPEFDATEQLLIPQQLITESGLSVWFKQDVTFNVPKGYIYISIDNPHSLDSNENIAMNRLFADLYSDAVVEAHYDAELAGIHYHLYAHQGGMTLQLSGISEKQHLLLNKLLPELRSFSYSESKFELFKQRLMTHWKNAENSKSISQLFAKLSAFMQPKCPDNKALAMALSKIDYARFSQYLSTLFDTISVEAFIHGNWHQKHAKQVAQEIKQVFGKKISKQYELNIPMLSIKDEDTIELPIVLPEHDHAIVVYYPMEDRSIATIARAMVVSQILSPHFFQEMRTEKQFGYLVGVNFVPINRYPGIAFYIQSPNVNAKTLSKEIDTFISGSLSLVEAMSEEEWSYLQKGLASQLQDKDTSLRIRSQRFWAAICNKEASFNQKLLLRDELQQLTLQDVCEFVKSTFVTTADKERIILTSLKNLEESDRFTNENELASYCEKISNSCSIKY